jgi:hypothetical protein
MDNEEQVCWAFDILPSQYNDLVFTTIWYDVVYKIKLKTGEFSTNHLQFYNSLAEIVTAAFGGEKKPEPKKVNEMNPDQAVKELNDFFRSFGGDA